MQNATSNNRTIVNFVKITLSNNCHEMRGLYLSIQYIQFSFIEYDVRVQLHRNTSDNVQ